MALVLFVLSQTPCTIKELSDELRLSKRVVKKAVNHLLKLGLIKPINKNRIPLDLLPMVMEKCKKNHPLDPLNVLEILDFYTISKKGRKYLTHAEILIFGEGGGYLGRKRRI